jgi:integrase
MAGKPFRRPNGSWSVVVELPADPATGKRRQMWLTAPTRKAVEAKQTRALRDRDEGLTTERANPTLIEQIASYLATEGLELRPRSRAIYAQGARLYVAPHLGAARVKQVTPTVLTRWLATLRGLGLSGNTIRTAWVPVRLALGQAHRLGLLARNPCDAVKGPSDDSAERPTLDAAQVRTLVACLAGDRYEAAYLLVLGTALRFGEILALRWSDLDLARGALVVGRQQTYEAGVGRSYAEVKSQAGRRTLALAPATANALRAHKARQNAARLAAGDRWQDHDLLFPRPDGTPLPEQTFRYHLKRAQRAWQAAGLPHLTFHDLRHQHATLGLRAGLHPKVMSKRLGHSSTRITMDRYQHVIDADDMAAAEAIGLLLAPRPAEDDTQAEARG